MGVGGYVKHLTLQNNLTVVSCAIESLFVWNSNRNSNKREQKE